MENRIADKHINYIFLNTKRDYAKKTIQDGNCQVWV